jgi:hypothetical protein
LEHALPIEIQPFDGFQVLTWIAFWTAFLERNCTGMPTVQIFIHEFDPRIVLSASWGYNSPGQIMM